MPWKKTTLAPGKINLYLDITAKREDGYHNLDTVMQSIDLSDHIRAELLTETAAEDKFHRMQQRLPESLDIGPSVTVSIRMKWPQEEARWLSISEIESNSCYLAAKAFWLHAVGEEGVRVGPRQRLLIHINKFIPVQSGLGGGSADCAAMLELLWSVYGKPFPYDELFDIGKNLGADVPFCLEGGTRYCTGIGDEMQYLPSLPSWDLVLIFPNIRSSTVNAFKRFDEAVLSGYVDDLGKAIEGQAFRTKLTEIVFNHSVSADARDPEYDLSDLQAFGGNRFVSVIEDDIPAIKTLLEGLDTLYPNALTGMSGSGTACYVLFGSKDADLDLSSLQTMLDQTLGSGQYEIVRSRLKREKLGLRL